MTIRQITGAPFDQNVNSVVETDEDYTVDLGITTVDDRVNGRTVRTKNSLWLQ